MGVPTLTLAGTTPPSRQGATILGHARLDAFIAHDAVDFEQKGMHWASHLDELANLRAELRERCDRSVFQHPEIIAAGLERALRIMWQRWCAGLPPEAIDVHSPLGETDPTT
jgi:predicted O-linked N-acetylglucosamine transferase (SPINDLY family)